MPRNEVQFQKGMSLSDFLEQYGTEAQCEQALFAWRWPQGFRCPECGHTGHCMLGRGLYQCPHCRRQTSITAGTLFAGTKLPLTKWLLAIYLLTQSKNGISALELSRQLGIFYNSAWLMKQKLMQAMLEREQGRELTGVFQMDDAYWGGRRRGYKIGRGTRGKTPLIAAVTTDPTAGSGAKRSCGSTRCWATSRMPCAARIAARFEPSTCRATWLNSRTASTGASIWPA